MNRVDSAQLVFKVLTLCKSFLKDYHKITADVPNDTIDNFDNLVNKFLTSNLKKRKK